MRRERIVVQHRVLIETSLNWEQTPKWVEIVTGRFDLPLIRLDEIFDPLLTPPERVVAAQYGYKPGTVSMNVIHRQQGGYLLLNWFDFFHKRRDIHVADLVDLVFTREYREAYVPEAGRSGRPEPAQADPFEEKIWARIRKLAGTIPIVKLPIEGTPEEIGNFMEQHLL